MEVSTDRAIYQMYYSKCFRANPKSIPKRFILEPDVGFASGYRRTENTWHLRFAGVLPEQRGEGYSKVILGIERVLQNEGVQYISLDVEKDNTPALHAVLALGFIPNGYRNDTHGVGYVEFIKDIGSE